MSCTDINPNNVPLHVGNPCRVAIAITDPDTGVAFTGNPDFSFIFKPEVGVTQTFVAGTSPEVVQGTDPKDYTVTFVVPESGLWKFAVASTALSVAGLPKGQFRVEDNEFYSP